MKKSLCPHVAAVSMLLTAVLLTGLVGCASGDPTGGDIQPSSASEPSSTGNTEEIGSFDFEKLYDLYLSDLMGSSILSTDWNSPSQIEPHQLIQLYAWRQLTTNPQPKDPDAMLRYPAKELEAFVEARFDWSETPLNLDKLHVKDSFGAHYDAADDTYSFEGFGAAAAVRVVEATQNGNLLDLTYEVLSRADDAPSSGAAC